MKKEKPNLLKKHGEKEDRKPPIPRQNLDRFIIGNNQPASQPQVQPEMKKEKESASNSQPSGSHINNSN